MGKGRFSWLGGDTLSPNSCPNCPVVASLNKIYVLLVQTKGFLARENTGNCNCIALKVVKITITKKQKQSSTLVPENFQQLANV